MPRARPRSRPASPGGSFYRAVWAVVRQIPRGRVASYGAVARAAGFPGRARQVAWALRGAPGSADLPWQRVVGAGGWIRLPHQAGLEQRLRLQAEGVTFAGTRARMEHHGLLPGDRVGPSRRRPRR